MSAFGTASGPCPCGSGEAYAACCEPLHLGALEAPTAEALMRSRYCAHALGVADYVLRTWHPCHRPPSLHLDPGTRWTGLEIDRVTGGGVEDAHGVVEFRAQYVSRGRPDELREVSRFERRAGRWFYVDGDTG